MCVVIRAGKGATIHTFWHLPPSSLLSCESLQFCLLFLHKLRGHASRVSHLDLLCDRHCSLNLSKADHIVSDHSANWVISSHKSSFFRAAGEAGTITASEEEKLRNDCRTALSCAPGKPNTTHYKIGRNRTNCPLRDLPKQMWGFIWQNMPHSSSAVLILGLGNSTEFYRQGWSHHPWGLVSLPVKNAPISANIQ